MQGEKVKSSMNHIELIGKVLASEARLYAKVLGPEEAKIAMALSKALSDPERVERFIKNTGGSEG